MLWEGLCGGICTFLFIPIHRKDQEMCDFVPVGIAFQVHFRCSKGNQALIRYKALSTWASRWRSAQATQHASAGEEKT